MNFTDDKARDRAELNSTSTCVPCTVVSFDLSGEPMVSVRPQVAVPFDTFDGDTKVLEPLTVDEVPYVFPSSAKFALFVPPFVGMEGFLVVSDVEVGDVPSGEAKAARRKDPRSGYFVPAGSLTQAPFKGSADWAELRSDGCRVAVSDDTVHIEAGSNSIVVSADGFDVICGGVSLIAAIKQLSDHIKALETLIHPNGMTHGSAHAHLIDTMQAAAPPTRAEQGVR